MQKPKLITVKLTESIQDTSPQIHPSRNKKPVSEKLAPRIYPWGQCFTLKSQISNLKSIDRKHPGYKPPDSFRKQTQDRGNKKPVSEKLAPRIYPWGQCFNLKSQISNLKSIDRKHPGYKPPDSSVQK